MAGIKAERNPRGLDARHDLRHGDAAVEEWVFSCWAADGSLGAVSAHRVVDRSAWYWAALVRPGAPLLHVTEWDIALRAEPSVLKAHGLWAEHVCDAPMEQWTITNECFAIALDGPDDALGRAYGTPTAVAFDLEWYATAPPRPLLAPAVKAPSPPTCRTGPSGAVRRDPDVAGSTDGAPSPAGYEQDGVVHGLVELPGERLTVAEIPARRWHRWGEALGPLVLPAAYAHTGLRAPFAFPDTTAVDWVLSPDGWRGRLPAR